jgi:lysophospholipase L1-like esterase
VPLLDIGDPLLGRSEAVVKDGVHPNDTGHAAIAAAVIEALKQNKA